MILPTLISKNGKTRYNISINVKINIGIIEPVTSIFTNGNHIVCDTEISFHDADINGWSGEIEYRFTSDKLMSGIYRLSYDDRTSYDTCIKDLTNTLDNKYGTSEESGGASGDTAMYRYWETNDTKIFYAIWRR